MRDFKVIHSKGREHFLFKGEDGRRHIVAAHRAIYISFYGSIPQGYEIHHIDFNKNNNDISNLVAIPEWQHKKYHRCVDYIRNISKIHSVIKNNPNSKRVISEKHYKELYSQGFRAIKSFTDHGYQYLVMRNCVGDTIQIPCPYLLDVIFEDVEIKKYSYEQLIEMGYKFVKEVFDGVAICYQFKSPFGNKICFKECDLFSK